MFNPYTIILSLFILAGVATMVWGWKVISNGRRQLAWPRTEGFIEESSADQGCDLLPHIVFSYSVEKQSYRRPMEFSGDITPSQEFVTQYLEKYPVGSKVQVSYDPAQTEQATLEPGSAKGDWLIFAIGLASAFFGTVFLIAGN